MSINDKIIDEVVASCRDKFRSFGGGMVDRSNPISMAMADEPAAFAAGVDIREVVNHVLSTYNKARYEPVKKS